MKPALVTRLPAVLLFLLCLSVSSQAQTKVKVVCRAEQSGVIVTSGVSSTTKAVKTFPGATVAAYQTGTTTPISLWSDAGGVTPLANPLTASSTDADCSFFATPGQRIDIRYSGVSAGIVSPFTRADIQVPYALNTFSSVATYITKTPDSTLASEFAMSTLATGLVKNTTSTGTPSIATANTDYLAPSQTYFTITASNSSGQTFTQIDQRPPNGSFPAYAGTIHTATNVLNANQFAFISRVTAGADQAAGLPAGQVQGYKVAGLFESRTTASTATDFYILALNGVAGCEASATGRCTVGEFDINQGYIASPSTTYTTHALTSNLAEGINITSGGKYQPHVGLEINASASDNKFIRAISIPYSGFSNRAIDIEDASDVIPASLSGLVAIRGVNGTNGSAITVAAATAGGPADSFAFSVSNNTGTLLLAFIDLTGGYVTKSASGFQAYGNDTGTVRAGFGSGTIGGSVTAGDAVISTYNTGAWTERLRVDNASGAVKASAGFYSITNGGFQAWKDSTPTKAAAFGVNVPGASAGDDAVISTYTGGSWTERARISSTAQTLSLFSASTITVSTSAPAGACTDGYLWIRTGGTNGKLSVCENGAWVTK